MREGNENDDSSKGFGVLSFRSSDKEGTRERKEIDTRRGAEIEGGVAGRKRFDRLHI